MNTVFLSGKAGIAVIESAGSYYCMAIESGSQPRPCSEIVLRSLVQQAGDLEEFEASDSFPFPSVWPQLERAYLADSALVFTLISLDRNVTPDLRQAAANEANDLITRGIIRSRVRFRLLSAPFPTEYADLSELARYTKLHELIDEARARTEEIQSAIDHWETATQQHGIQLVVAARLREVCARDGFFAAAVDAITLGKTDMIDQCAINIGHHLGIREYAPFFEIWLEGIRKDISTATRARDLTRHPAPAPLYQLLRDLGVSDVERSVGTASLELRSAFEKLERQYKQRPDVVETTCRSRTFYLPIIPYGVGRDDGLLPEHTKMHEFICSLALRNSHMGEVEPTPRVDHTFDSVLDDVDNTRLIILSFMFGVGVRREELGILPLGRQEAIGFVFHRLNEPVANLVRTFEAHALAPSGEIGSTDGCGGISKLLSRPEKISLVGTTFSEADGQRFIARLVQTVRQMKGIIYYPNSYSMKDMIAKVLLERRVAPELRIMKTTPDLHTNQMFPQRGQQPAREPLKNWVFSFDPGELQLVERLMANSTNDYTVVCVRHGLRVPVGLGVSLAMLPSLLLKDSDTGQPIWQLIIEEAKKIYLQPDIVEQHARGGIKLDAPLDPLHRLLAGAESLDVEQRELWRGKKK